MTGGNVAWSRGNSPKKEPQGKILGLILFFIYINDLTTCLEFSDTQMYADNTNLTVASSSKNEIELTINNLENMRSWLRANRLSLNTTKSEVLFVGSRQRSSCMSYPSLLIGEANVPKVLSAKPVGVHIDEVLTWVTRIEETSQTLTSVI